MASIDTTRVWGGVTVRESTDTDTARITLSSDSNQLLAHSDGSSWELDDASSFARLLNNANLDTNQELTQEDFNQLFFNDGTSIFNRDRADILNDPSSYESPDRASSNRTAFFESGVPLVRDPKTGRTSNSDGFITDLSPTGSDEGTSGNITNFSTTSRSPNNSRSSGGSSSGAGGALRYPVSQLPDLDYDFVQFEIYDYVNKGQLTAQEPEDRLGSKLGTITLPMVGQLAESSQVDWAEDNLNKMQEMAATAAMNTMEDPSKIGQALGDLGGEAQQLIKDNPGAARNVAAYFAGQALGVNLQARSTGNVLNPNLELLFKGPKLRTFNFNFKFRPRFKEESIMVRQIIKAFKRSMAPNRAAGGLFLQTPNVFKITYTHAGEDHPFMNHIKPCALTNFNVSYTPDNSYMTYPDGGLTGYDVQFTMGEMLPIFQEDHDKVGGTGY